MKPPLQNQAEAASASYDAVACEDEPVNIEMLRSVQVRDNAADKVVFDEAFRHPYCSEVVVKLRTLGAAHPSAEKQVRVLVRILDLC